MGSGQVPNVIFFLGLFGVGCDCWAHPGTVLAPKPTFLAPTTAQPRVISNGSRNCLFASFMIHYGCEEVV